ncbi:MAG: pyridoxal-phosphate dependent enzyme, partial [Solirubrobacteraceae bacterium]
MKAEPASIHRPTKPQAEDIRRAAEAGTGVIRETPLLSSRTLTERAGMTVALKAENLQRTGSFKLRGALAKLASLG